MIGIKSANGRYAIMSAARYNLVVTLRSAAIATAVLFGLGASDLKAATIERMDVGRADVVVFMINGQFAGGETIELQRQIAKLPTNLPVSVILHSPGGSLREGLELGEFFYKARISTFVMGYGGLCASACALAFLGGRDAKTGKPSRVKMNGGRLGFHQFNISRSEADKAKVYSKADMEATLKGTRSVTFAIMTYLTRIQEDMSKLHLMLKAPSEDMNFISSAEALALGINVMGEDADEFIQASAIQARIKRP